MVAETLSTIVFTEPALDMRQSPWLDADVIASTVEDMDEEEH